MKKKLSDDVKYHEETIYNEEDVNDELQNERYRQKTNQQKFWSIFVVFFISIWSISVIVMTFLSIKTEAVEITLLTTTLAQIVALPIIVCKYFFSK